MGEIIIPATTFLIASLVEIAAGYICKDMAEEGGSNGTDAYQHCMQSCIFSRCMGVVNGPVTGAIASFVGGVFHELTQKDENSFVRAMADIKSNMKGIVGGFNFSKPCAGVCECEKSRRNP